MEGQESLDPNCISFQPTHLCNDYHKTLVTLPRQPAMTEPVKQSGGPDSTEEDDEDIWSEGVDTLSVDLNADVKDQTKETSHGGGDDLNEAKNRNNRVSWLTEDIASPEITVELSSKFTPVLTPTSSSSSTSTNTTSGILPQKTGERSAFFTIGLVGHPNAGKSSLINALAGRKVVSVSSTPGHTKHLQTIFLNQHTRFCDCPGLVFPTTGVPYPLQVLGGQVNTAQVRETFSTLAYVGMRYPLERAYSLDSHSLSASFSSSMSIIDRTKSLKEMGAAQRWSGFGLAEAYAVKRGYYTKKERPDAHRAGNEILRDLQTGKVPFAVSPPLTLFN